MLLPLLLSLFAQAGPAQPADRSASIADFAERDDGARSLGLSAGSTSTPVGAFFLSPPPIGYAFGLRPSALQMLITGIGTGYDEPLVLQFPLKAGFKAPLLVAFHKFGAKESDPFTDSNFPAECAQRNWFLLSSLGATKKGFSSVASQANREAALNWVVDTFGAQIDSDRIYAVGFSMGGGSALNYAARHQAPSDLQFAAVANHTGTISLEHAWLHESLPVHEVMQFWFGGSPFAQPFAFQRSSVMSFVSASLTPNPTRSMCANIRHLPTLMVNVDNDPVTYLIEQTQIYYAYMNSLGAPVEYVQLAGNTHDWKTVDAGLICDFLGDHVRQPLGLAGQTLADRSGAWAWFEVEQQAVGQFTPFGWEFIPDWNLLILSDTSNLARITFDAVASPLDPTLGLTVQLNAKDFFADQVRLLGYPQAPSQVLRDEIVTSAWGYDAVAGAVTLFEADTQVHAWRILP